MRVTHVSDGDFSVVAVNPGERLIIRPKEPLRTDEAARLRAALTHFFPGAQVGIIGPEFDVIFPADQ